jgi:cell division initiation protein
MRLVFVTPPEIQHLMLQEGRGYDRTAVDTLLEHAASSYEQVWLERDQLRSRVIELEGELAGFRELERYLGDTLATAQRAADEVRARAEQDAERVKSDALADAQRAEAKGRRELDELRAEIERFRTLDRTLHSDLRAFVQQTLGQIEDGTAPRPAVERLTRAQAPQTTTPERHEA